MDSMDFFWWFVINYEHALEQVSKHASITQENVLYTQSTSIVVGHDHCWPHYTFKTLLCTFKKHHVQIFDVSFRGEIIVSTPC